MCRTDGRRIPYNFDGDLDPDPFQTLWKRIRSKLYGSGSVPNFMDTDQGSGLFFKDLLVLNKLKM